jgi:hypothetical protein
MTEHLSPKLIAEEEASRIIVAEIRAYPQGGDKREEHLRLFGELLPREEIEALWAERYAEIARIEEAKPKIVAYRRFAKKEQSSANAAQSFSVPAPQPAADEAPKDAQEERPFSLPAVLPAKRLEVKRVESRKEYEQKAKADGAVGVLDPSNPLQSLSGSSPFVANTTALG